MSTDPNDSDDPIRQVSHPDHSHTIPATMSTDPDDLADRMRTLSSSGLKASGNGRQRDDPGTYVWTCPGCGLVEETPADEPPQPWCPDCATRRDLERQ